MTPGGGVKLEFFHKPRPLEKCGEKRELGEELTAHHHHRHGENLLAVGGRGDVAEADGGEAGHGEVEGGDVQGVLVGASLPLARPAGIVAVGRADAQRQLV